MNSKKRFGLNFKRPLSESTFNEYNKLFEKAEKYIRELLISQPIFKDKQIIWYELKKVISTGIWSFSQPIRKCLVSKLDWFLFTASKTGFIGLIVGMSSFKNIYKRYIETKELQYLLTFKFSQDHIETFFSLIRSRGGFNKNPNCSQFKIAFKRLIMRNELQSSLNGNWLADGTNHADAINKTIRIKRNTTEIADDPNDDDEEEEIDVVNIFTDGPKQLTQYVSDVVAHIAGYVERHLKKKCPQCLTCLSTKNVFYGRLTVIKNQDGLINLQQKIKIR